MKRISPGALVFPGFALAYTGYSLWGQVSHNLRGSLITYALVLSIPIFALAAMALVQEWRAAPSGEAGKAGQDTGSRVRPALIVLLATATVAVMPWAGYLIAFALFIVGAMAILGTRRPMAYVAVLIPILALVYYVFADWLQLNLPEGILKGVL